MSDYVQTTSFAPKDALATGNPSKLIKGTEIDPEFAAIAVAITSKYDSDDIASNAEAAAFTSDAKLITPLKLAYALANGSHGLATTAALSGYAVTGRLISAGTGLTGGGSLAADRTLALSAGSIASLALADTAVQPAALSTYVPTSRTVSVSGALTGGGDLSANRTITLDVNGMTEETGIQGSLDYLLIYDASVGAYRKATPNNVLTGSSGYVTTGRQVISGAGLTGGGDLSADRTLAVGAGTGITVNADDVALSAGSLASLALADTSVQPARSLTAGAGLTGGGSLAADRTFAVGAGTGITVNADDVALSAGTQASLALADSAVQPARSISVSGTGLSGGGSLAADRTITIDQTAMTTRNITGKAGVTKTLSTVAASGGSDGDIWYRY